MHERSRVYNRRAPHRGALQWTQRVLQGAHGYCKVLTGTVKVLKGTARCSRVLQGTQGYCKVLTGTVKVPRPRAGACRTHYLMGAWLRGRRARAASAAVIRRRRDRRRRRHAEFDLATPRAPRARMDACAPHRPMQRSASAEPRRCGPTFAERRRREYPLAAWLAWLACAGSRPRTRAWATTPRRRATRCAAGSSRRVAAALAPAAAATAALGRSA